MVTADYYYAMMIFLQSWIEKLLAWAAGDWTHNLGSLLTVRCLWPFSHGNPKIEFLGKEVSSDQLLPLVVTMLIRVSTLWRAAVLSINSSVLILFLIWKVTTGFPHIILSQLTVSLLTTDLHSLNNLWQVNSFGTISSFTFWF